MHPHGVELTGASRCCLRPAATLQQRPCVFGAFPSQGEFVQFRIEPKTPSHGFLVLKTELSCACSSSGLPWLAQEIRTTPGRVQGDQLAAAVQRTRQGADSIKVTSKLGESMDKLLSSTALVNSGNAPSVAAGDTTEDASLTRWEFLKSIRHRLIRDIAFVIASPSLLQDSRELPTVSSGMLGGDDNNWAENAYCLKQLDGDSVESWFKARPTRNRLGDHFALCVEYVLRFLPSTRIHRLVVSQQVVEQESTADKQLSTVSSSQASHENSPSLKTVGRSKLDKDPNMCITGVQLDGNESITSLPLEVTRDGEDSLHVGRRKKRMLQKLQRAAASLGIPRTVGEFDFLFQLKRGLTTIQTANCLETDSLPLVPHPGNSRSVSWSKGFENLNVTGGQEVQHWEVTVKFLLYTGPWEPFGLETPELASWSKIKRSQVIDSSRDSRLDCADAKTEAQEEYSDEDEDEEVDPTFFSRDHIEVVPDSARLPTDLHGVNAGDNFFGCFLGPHVGESLAEKKNRLRTQLALSGRPEALTLIHKLFPEEKFDGNSAEIVQQSILGNRIEVFPRALLKGYLFYEYNLWRILRKMDTFQAQKHEGLESWPSKGLSPADGKHPRQAMLNRGHWMGWWCHINEFIHIPFRTDSRWYIVPKLEWLSPVIIEGDDGGRCEKVLDIPKLREAAAKLSAEAKEKNIPRKRRVLLAEVRWECNALDPKDGRWVEASRGFIVEKTWPNSRLYQRHGFDLVVVPNIGCWTPNVSFELDARRCCEAEQNGMRTTSKM